MKFLAFIQARMGSSRLSGKVLKKLGNERVLDWCVKRASQARYVSKVVVLIPNCVKDDVLYRYCCKRRYTVFRGDERDVLGRFYEASKQHPAPYYARLTADSPLVDPALLDELFTFFLKQRCAFAGVDLNTVPLGVAGEIFTAAALRVAARTAIAAAHREHVTKYLYENPERFRTARLRTRAYPRPFYRLTLDTKEDLGFLKRLQKQIPMDVSTSVGTITRFLDRHPEFVSSHFEKKLSRKINTPVQELFRWTHASHMRGTGHSRRSQEVAEQLVNNPYGISMKERLFHDCQRLEETVAQSRGGILLADLPHYPEAVFAKIRRRNPSLFISIFDCKTPLREKLFNLHFRLMGLETDNTNLSKIKTGLQFAIVKKDLLPYRRRYKVRPRVTSVLICFGGSDPSDHTLRVIEDLSGLRLSIRVTILTGPLYRRISTLYNLIAEKKWLYKPRVFRNVAHIGNFMRRADWLFCGGGGTLLEALYLGLPACVYPQNQAESKFFAYFQKDKAALAYPGAHGLWKVLKSSARERRGFSERGKLLVDGQGVNRIANIILNESFAGVR